MLLVLEQDVRIQWLTQMEPFWQFEDIKTIFCYSVINNNKNDDL